MGSLQYLLGGKLPQKWIDKTMEELRQATNIQIDPNWPYAFADPLGFMVADLFVGVSMSEDPESDD